MNRAVIRQSEFLLEQVEESAQPICFRGDINVYKITPGAPPGDRADFHASDVMRIGHFYLEQFFERKQDRVSVAEEAYFSPEQMQVKRLAAFGKYGEFIKMLECRNDDFGIEILR